MFIESFIYFHKLFNIRFRENQYLFGSMSIDLHEVLELIDRDGLVHLLPEEPHEALQILRVAEYIALLQDRLEALSRQVPLVLQIHKPEEVSAVQPSTDDVLLPPVQVAMHLATDVQHLDYELGRLFLERVLH